jgi:hypothetical protein
VQAYFYWRALKEIVKHDDMRISETASIWLLGDHKHTFSPVVLNCQMEFFLFSNLPDIIERPEDQISWHYNARCQSCQWEKKCRTRAEKEQNISMIPDLTLDNARFLHDALQMQTNENRMNDIEDLVALTTEQRLSPIQRNYPTTAKKIRKLLGMHPERYESSRVLEAVTTDRIQVIYVFAQLLSNRSLGDLHLKFHRVNNISSFSRSFLIQGLRPWDMNYWNSISLYIIKMFGTQGSYVLRQPKGSMMI